MDRHYHPIVFRRLQDLLSQHNWGGAVDYLDQLSHAQFRTAGYMLAERLLPQLSQDEFWTLTRILVAHNSKAYLVTTMKCAATLMAQDKLHVTHPGCQDFLADISHSEIDRQKALLQILPHIGEPELMEDVLTRTGASAPPERLSILLRAEPTMPVAYMLFRTLMYLENDRHLLIRTTYYLMKRGDGFSFNLASIIKHYFGLDEVKGTFSLQFQDYELSRISQSYPAFVQVMRF